MTDRTDTEMRALKATSTPGIPFPDLVPDQEKQQLRDQLNDLYRERAQLLAWLAARDPSAVLAPAPDVKDPRWRILFLRTGHGQWQLTWHIAPSDVALFSGIERVDADDPRAQWDGHTTDQKYQRIRAHVGVLMAGLMPTSAAACARRRCLAPSCGPKCSNRLGGGL